MQDLTKRDTGSSRRAFLSRAAALGAAAVMPLGRALAETDAESYILLVVCDALRADHLGCYGYQRAVKGVKQSITPVLDGFAERGVLYENCIAQASWTQTSMVSLFYSAWPVIKGAQHTFDYVPEKAEPLKGAAPGLSRVGVYTNPYLTDPIYNRLFETYKYIKYKEYAPAQVMNTEFDWAVGPTASNGKAFLGYVHYMDPHEPYNYKHEFRGLFTPEGWKYQHPLEVNEKLAAFRDDSGKVTAETPKELAAQVAGTLDAYDEDVYYMDKHLKGLLNVLKYYKAQDRTTIIITADHGQAFGEHGWCGHKQTLYQEEIHVPLIIIGPDIPRGVRVKAQVRNVDIVPTIAAIMGSSPHGYVGTPLLPANRAEGQGSRVAYSCCDYAIYGKASRLLTCMVTRDRLKYIRVLTQDRKPLREELYDLGADAGEKHDLLNARADVAADVARKMDTFESSAFWRTIPGQVPQMDKAAEEQLRALGYTNGH